MYKSWFDEYIKILAIVPVAFFFLMTLKYIEVILYKIHFSKCGYGVIIIIFCL